MPLWLSCAAVQVNGGDAAAKVDYAYSLFEKEVTVDAVVQQNDMIDTIAVTKGRGTEGVIARCAPALAAVGRCRDHFALHTCLHV